MSSRYAIACVLAFAAIPMAHAKKGQPTVIVTSNTALPVVTSGAETLVIKYINPLHYQYSLQVSSTNITAPAAPSVIAPGVTTTGVFPAPPSPPPPPTPPTISSTKKNTIEEQWKAILEKLNSVRKTAISLKQKTDRALFTASTEEQCYKDRLSFYSSFLLDEKTADSLKQFAKNNESNAPSGLAPSSASDSCRHQEEEWPFGGLQSAEAEIYSLQSDVFDMMTMDGFKEWKDKNGDSYTAVTTLVGNLLTQIQSLESGSDVAKNFQAAQVYNNFWRVRIEEIAQSAAQVAQAEAALQKDASNSGLQAAAAAAHQKSRLEYTLTLNCSTNWYGRGRVDTITLHYSDVTATSSTDQSSQIAVNSCLTPATVSTGIGMSFLRNQQFGFVSGRDPNNPANTISVIGATTDQQVTPLYALQYNIAIKDFNNGMGVQGAIGAALGSSSGTANIELIAGPAFSIKRRAFFITPAFQLARRDSLLPGFKVGDPQGSLTAIPTHSSWKPGFALTFTFAVAQ